MYRIKLFNGEQPAFLQQEINKWLHLNKDILIHNSNLSADKNANLGTNEYNFFILYTGPDEQGEELKELAATVTQQQSVEVKEMNPEIMKPSS